MTTTNRKKIKLIFVPFLLTLIGFDIVFTAFHWLLIINLKLFSVKDTVTHLFAPMVLSWIPILFYLRPRLKLLDLENQRGSWVTFYMIIIWLSLLAPTAITQSYLEIATGKLVHLDNINSIKDYEQAKYCTVKDFYLDKQNIGVKFSFEVTGRHDEDLKMQVHITTPILLSEADTLNTSCSAFIGVKYSQTISNNLSDEKKEEQLNVFAKKCQMDYDKENLTQFAYLDRVGNTDDGDHYKEALESCTKYNTNGAAIFKAVKEPFEQRFGNTLMWLLFSLGGGTLAGFVLVLIPKFNEIELEKFESGKPSQDEELMEFIDFIKPKEGYFITPILIYINTAVYLVMVCAGLGFMTFNGEDLLNWGANYGPSTKDGEWWRLLSCTFLHGGLMHLFTNMYGLLFIGIFLEPLLGRTKYLLAYILTGVLASCASLWRYDATVSIGASGAIFGLYGIFLALLLTKVFEPEFAKSFLTHTLIFIGLNLFMGLAGGIDNAAHIGGLLSGFVFGLIFRATLKIEDHTI